VLGTAGLVEFWRWNHDYGHNLSPDAPIKIPGMTYSAADLRDQAAAEHHTTLAPLVGTLFVVLSVLAAAAALYVGRRGGATPEQRRMAGGRACGAWVRRRPPR
jgi:copper chaperone NosL